MNCRRVVRWILVVSCLSGMDRSAVAQPSDDLFESGTLHDLRLFIHSNDLRQLRDRYLDNTYYPVDLHWRNLRVRNAGVRSRGLGSRSATKPGLRIDFDRYSAGQRFLGLGSLILDNLVQDPALVRERVAMAFFERMGQPAPRESFCRLFINDVYQGLYAFVEPVDAGFLSRTLGETAGYLFERTFAFPFYGEDLGDDETAYGAVFEPRTREREAAGVLYAPIRDLFHEVNQPVDAVWRQRVAEYLDLEQFVTHVAVETFLSESDGMLGFAGMANFYLYRSAGATRHRVIVWDKDRAFSEIDSPIMRRADENILVRRALAFDDLRTLYWNVLEQCARASLEENWLETEIIRASTLIDAAAREDPWKPVSNEVYTAAVAFLIDFARQRPEFVRQDVARERAIR